MEVAYQRWFDGIKRPIVDIELIFENRMSYRTKALVDSGADSCVFDIEIFEKLGIDTSRYPSRNSIGAGGNRFKTVEVPLFIRFNNVEIQAKANCCSFRDSHGEIVGVNLLGRDDFFKQFKITFDEQNKKMTFH